MRSATKKILLKNDDALWTSHVKLALLHTYDMSKNRPRYSTWQAEKQVIKFSKDENRVLAFEKKGKAHTQILVDSISAMP